MDIDPEFILQLQKLDQKVEQYFNNHLPPIQNDEDEDEDDEQESMFVGWKIGEGGFIITITYVSDFNNIFPEILDSMDVLISDIA